MGRKASLGSDNSIEKNVEELCRPTQNIALNKAKAEPVVDTIMKQGRCCKCGSTTGKLISSSGGKLYCEECLNKEKEALNSKDRFRSVLTEIGVPIYEIPKYIKKIEGIVIGANGYNYDPDIVIATIKGVFKGCNYNSDMDLIGLIGKYYHYYYDMHQEAVRLEEYRKTVTQEEIDKAFSPEVKNIEISNEVMNDYVKEKRNAYIDKKYGTVNSLQELMAHFDE